MTGSGGRYPRRVRNAAAPVLLAGASVLAWLVATAPGSGAVEARPRVTVIGDSVAASLLHVPKARAVLGRGLDLHVDARVCRRLVGTSCPFQGSRPANVVDTIASSPDLGAVVVIDVGYNDDPGEYRAGIETVMRALARAGVQTVVWSTLKVDRPSYRRINAAIHAAAKQWRQLRVVDWDAHTRAHGAWFVADGLHVNARGAMALARWLRGPVAGAACGGRCPPRATAG